VKVEEMSSPCVDLDYICHIKSEEIGRRNSEHSQDKLLPVLEWEDKQGEVTDWNIMGRRV